MYHGAYYALPATEIIVGFRVEVVRPLAGEDHAVGWFLGTNPSQKIHLRN